MQVQGAGWVKCRFACAGAGQFLLGKVQVKILQVTHFLLIQVGKVQVAIIAGDDSWFLI